MFASPLKYKDLTYSKKTGTPDQSVFAHLTTTVGQLFEKLMEALISF